MNVDYRTLVIDKCLKEKELQNKVEWATNAIEFFLFFSCVCCATYGVFSLTDSLMYV